MQRQSLVQTGNISVFQTSAAPAALIYRTKQQLDHSGFSWAGADSQICGVAAAEVVHKWLRTFVVIVYVRGCLSRRYYTLREGLA